LTPLAAVIGMVSAICLFRYRINSAWLILGGALCGLLLKLVHPV
jgi:hypothetical protein